MIFTSYTYLLFLFVGVVAHWSAPERLRNPLLVALSYGFYCSWRWPYGVLLAAVSLFTWLFGRLIARRPDVRHLLALGVSIELLPLIFYKYTGFLASNVNMVASAFGAGSHIDPPSLVLPLGISFFTFQGIAYLVDISTGEAPIGRLDQFLLYKAFWPQLIAGPIIRPHEISDQIAAHRQLDYEDVAFGCRRILFGFLKKAVLADTLAPYVDAVFQPTAAPGAVDCVIAAIAFAMQIYFDFSGYSDVAIGSARLLGFRFPENFEYPYSALSPQEFWNRWHMTLTRWIRDYVFTPLAFTFRRQPRMGHLALILAMALCGLWHGGRWTFIVWGIWHGLLLVANHTVLRGLWASSERSAPHAAKRILAWTTTMVAVTCGWIFFRAETMSQALKMLSAILTLRSGLRPAVLRENGILIIAAVALGLIVFGASREPARALVERMRPSALGYRVMKGTFYAAVVLAVVVFQRDVKAFVYFQF